MENFDFDRYLLDLDTKEKRCYGWHDEYVQSVAESEIDKIFEESGFKPIKLPKFDKDDFFLSAYVEYSKKMKKKEANEKRARTMREKKEAARLEKLRQEELERERQHRIHQARLESARIEQERKYAYLYTDSPTCETRVPVTIVPGYTTVSEYAEASIRKHRLESKDVAVVVAGSDMRSFKLHGLLMHEHIFGLITIDDKKQVIMFCVPMDNGNYACVVAFDSVAYDCANIKLQQHEAKTALYRFTNVHEKLRSRIYGYTTDADLADWIDELIRSLQREMLDEVVSETRTEKWEYPIDYSYNAVTTRQCFGKDCMKCPMRKHCVDIQHEVKTCSYVNNIYIRDGWV